MTNQRPNNPFFKEKGSYYSRRERPFGKSFTRTNDRIRAREVRVIGSDGQQLGIMPTFEAVALARKQSLDLVEISPNANPPVCKILDFGKYKYDESKKNKGSSKQNSVKVKEIKLRVGIDTNDYNTKLRHAMGFLDEGNKLKLSLMFRGRELAHTELGFERVNQFIADIKEYGTPDVEPKLFGKTISTSISPVARKQGKLTSVPSSATGAPQKILNINELLELK